MTDSNSLSLHQAAQAIRLLAMDVDGVLTPGEIVYLSSGEEVKAFNVKDGQGLTMAKRAGITLAIITARTSPANEKRAKELEIDHVFQGIKNKFPVIQELSEKYSIPMEHIAYMGDDLPDLKILPHVGLPCCPADAVDAVKEVCLFKSTKNGGQGAVRELTDLMLSARGAL